MILYKYVQPGAYFAGVPARDLTDADVAALELDQVATLALAVAVGIYTAEGQPSTAEAVFAAMAPKPAQPLNPLPGAGDKVEK